MKIAVDRADNDITHYPPLNAAAPIHPKFIVAVYVKSNYFNGQNSAAELIVQGLRDRGWQVCTAEVMGIDRNGHPFIILLRTLRILPFTLWTWLKIVYRGSNHSFYVALGQTKFSLIREGLPLLVRRLVRQKQLGVISLHGHSFTEWHSQNLEAKLLCYFAKTAQYITVLGPTQREKLIALGLPEQQVVIMDNTCQLQPIDRAQLLLKQHQSHPNDANHPTTILFLSNLIESKGYLNFVAALALLAQQEQVWIDAVICGRFMMGRETQPRFTTTQAATTWLEQQIVQINQSPTVRLRWVHGAEGEVKERLFQQAQIFVLPTEYFGEAQPIVILEALASGCAVVTTQIGELAATVSPETAVFLDDTTPTTIATTLLKLSADSDLRTQLATNGHQLFLDRFTYKDHLDRWEALLKTLEVV